MPEMILGLPWTAWLLLLAATGGPLLLELVHLYRNRRLRGGSGAGPVQPEDR